MSGSITQLVGGLFWPADPTTQVAIGILLGLALLTIATIYLPIAARMIRISQLQRSVQACFDEESSNTIQRQEVANAFTESPLAYHWSEFVRRWQNAIAADPIQDASLPELSRAPVRLTDVLDEHPLIEAGARRSLIPALPAIFLSAGLLGAFAGLVLALPGIALSLDPPGLDSASRSQQISSLMEHLGMALRVGLWGLLLSLAAAIAGRVIEGRSEILAETLDSWVQLAYGSISTGEMTTRTAHEQRAAIARLQDEVAELGRLVSSRPRPLIRAGASVPGAAATSGDSEVSAQTLERLGAEVSRQVAQKLEQALPDQLSALPDQLSALPDQLSALPDQLSAIVDSLNGALERLGSAPGSSGLDEAVDRLVKSSDSQTSASESLSQTARTVSDASEELRAGLDDFADAVTQMRQTGAALALTSQRVDSAQVTASRASETLASSLERSETGASEHRAHVDTGLEELRSGIALLADRLEQTESATPVAAADPQRETENAAAIQQELHRVATTLRSELGDQLKETASALEDRLLELSVQLDGIPERSASKPELRPEQRPEPEPEPTIPDEPTVTVQPEPAPPPAPGPRSEADTIPYMEAPKTESIYARGLEQSAGASPPAPAPREGADVTLSGLLRPTHHSGPSSPNKDDTLRLDAEDTLSIELDKLPLPEGAPEADPVDDADATHDDPEDDDDRTPRRGLFGRRK